MVLVVIYCRWKDVWRGGGRVRSYPLGRGCAAVAAFVVAVGFGELDQLERGKSPGKSVGGAGGGRWWESGAD